MNNYNVNDENFINSSLYKNFIRVNSGEGKINIRAYAASQAIPISNMDIVISTNINNNKVIFFEGKTNQSGVIENIKVPAPPILNNNLTNPPSLVYEISARYIPDNINKVYSVNIYDNLTVIQNISIVPDTVIKAGGFIGR